MPKEGEVVVNEYGAKHAYVAARMDLIPPENLLLLGECLAYGAANYGENNWQGISEKDNLNHALVHILKWLSGDRSEPHLVNAIARTNFALWHAIQAQEQPTFYNHPNLLKDHDEDGEEEVTEEELRSYYDTEGPENLRRFIDIKKWREDQVQFSDPSYIPAGTRATSLGHGDDRT